MKTNEVPQDGSILEKSGVRDVCYAVDENGEYKQVISVGWDPKNDAINYAWQTINEECEEIKKEIIAGKKSPLALHIHRVVMTPEILAGYSGFTKHQIKKWCKAKHFNKLSESELEILARALNIEVKQLVSTD